MARRHCRPDETQDDAQWRTAGDRIQTLLDASAAGGAVARERAEQLVREVTDLYGAGLERMLDDGIDRGRSRRLADRVRADDLVASLLLVHGLHPHDVERRCPDALDSVRPYLGSHGGDVHLLEVAGEVVRLQFTGSCKSCPSSSVTLELAVEDAVGPPPRRSSRSSRCAQNAGFRARMIPADSLMSRVHAQRRTTWHPVPDSPISPWRGRRIPGRGHDRAGVPAVTDLFAYHDRCGAAVSRWRRALHRLMAATPCCGARAATPLRRRPRRRGTNGAADASGADTAAERDGVLSIAVVADEVAP